MTQPPEHETPDTDQQAAGASSGDDDGQEIQVSFHDALRLTLEVHKAGQLDRAREHYDELLRIGPDDPDLLHFSGILEHQLENSAEAIVRINRAIDAVPDNPDMHANIGNVYLQSGESERALESFGSALALQPAHVNAICNQGVALRTLDREEEAMAQFSRALELAPEHGESWHNRGTGLRMQRRWDEAIECFEKALQHGGYLHSTRRATVQVVRILHATEREDEALKVLRDWIARDPEDPVAQHMLAGATGENVPKRASKTVVVETFRSFATDFDEVLERLDYQAPKLVGERVRALLPAPNGTLLVCDAGCGTGLVAGYLKPYASRLVGVDLSVSMLTKARARDLYDELVEEELTEYFELHPQRFDVVTSVDTLCYIGALEEVMVGAASTLKAGGLLCFTVEKAPADAQLDKGYGLAHHGRYHHVQAYIETLLAANFAQPQIETVVLRREVGEHVTGLLVSAVRS
ncbi:MAG: tetratricopeptide repeat protein [Pseudomonadota bacterium]